MNPQIEWKGDAVTLLHNEPLWKHTSWRVGGPARSYYQPTDREALSAFLQSLPSAEPLLWLGLGSNLLVRDGGFAGTVIALRGCLDEIILLDNQRLWVGAGASCAKVARTAARAGLCGAAFLGGIPGTMGGALAMNAGAFGCETWNRVLALQSIDRYGVIHARKPLQYQVGYRQVNAPAGEWFLGCELQLQTGDVAAEQQQIRNLLHRRNATQPLGQATAGSTFRNPEGDYAARLIEASYLKGYRIGGARVSEKHANFIVNGGDATAADIEALIEYVQKVVKKRQGVELETEVHIVGEAV